jgi:hypothetical protein
MYTSQIMYKTRSPIINTDTRFLIIIFCNHSVEKFSE